MSDRDVENYIMDLMPDNSEYIKNAMYGNFIKNGVSFSHDLNVDHYDKKTVDCNGIEKYYYIYNTQDISDLHNVIIDSEEFKEMSDLLKNTESLLLDIDLDFFTYKNDPVFSKNRRDIMNQLNSHSLHYLIEKSEVITIALEPNHCGSVQDCLDILECFTDVFEFLDYDQIQRFLLKY